MLALMKIANQSDYVLELDDYCEICGRIHQDESSSVVDYDCSTMMVYDIDYEKQRRKNNAGIQKTILPHETYQFYIANDIISKDASYPEGYITYNVHQDNQNIGKLQFYWKDSHHDKTQRKFKITPLQTPYQFQKINKTIEPQIPPTPQLDYQIRYIIGNKTTPNIFYHTSDMHLEGNTRPQNIIEHINTHDLKQQDQIIGLILTGDSTYSLDLNTQFQKLFYQKPQGQLKYQLYEGIGNHDQQTIQEIKTRNTQQPPRNHLKTISKNKYHYSWQTNNTQFIMLNYYPGNGTNTQNENSYNSLEFLKTQLTDKKQATILAFHLGLTEPNMQYNNTYWTTQDQEIFYNTIKNYNIIAILNGHTHYTYPFYNKFGFNKKKFNVFNCGSGAWHSHYLKFEFQDNKNTQKTTNTPISKQAYFTVKAIDATTGNESTQITFNKNLEPIENIKLPFIFDTDSWNDILNI